MDKLGLIAGGGALPVEVARACVDAGRSVFVVRLKGLADPALDDYPGVDAAIGELGKMLKALKAAKCAAVCMTGVVQRPDFSKLAVDMRGLAALPGIILAARKGDDGLLRAVVRVFEKDGFRIEGAQDVARGLTLEAGPLGRFAPSEEHQEDIDRALSVAREIGRLDIGQGAVSARGLVLAVEAQEGTDAMLRRVADLPPALRGTPEHLVGVLAKAPKPIQERRVDLPTIGLATVQRAAKAGLAGIVGEAGGLLVLDREEVIAEADALGLFIYGVAPDEA
jgi:DUF1009 family protein